MSIVSGSKLVVRAVHTVEKGGNISTLLHEGLGIIFAFQNKAGLQVEDFMRSSMNEAGTSTHSKYGPVLERAS
ncbi:hypothetical protein CGCVW01_v005237 [Colletotrichum viniferum]|nr:hypothetical protein CGCVW01_v005237 [Colletotrichum viniferum]